ncbi:ABC transporter-like protein [Corchorus olitorius]|uniref:ABC transporter-like protein n=1 Tax=Corchorus olitorius TaxID=93759 RepID=A0A1R3H059_9ROSI|nr:ABC transporter-like protein [Corchorus olitorius]
MVGAGAAQVMLYSHTHISSSGGGIFALKLCHSRGQHLHLRPHPAFFSMSRRRGRSSLNINCCASQSQSQSQSLSYNTESSQTQKSKALLDRFWKVAAPYWFSDDDKFQARLQLAGVFALTLATTGISVGFNFLGRDFYNALANNPDQRIVDDLSAFTSTALSFSLTLFNAAIDLISFSNILYGIYPPLFLVLLLYSIGGTAISIYLGKGLVSLNFLQEKKEADFRYGLVRVRENAESIAFYSGEDNELQLLLQRFTSAFENLTQLLISSRNLEFFTNGYRYLIQILPAAVVAPMYFSGKIEFGVINQSVSAFNHILGDFSLIVYQFQAISAFSAVIDRLGEFDDVLDSSRSESLSDSVEQINLTYVRGSQVMGPSGSGKTSLLRALAGLWNTGNGKITFYVEDEGDSQPSTSSNVAPLEVKSANIDEEHGRPINSNSRSVFFLPQRPYMVLGTLRQQLLYPTWAGEAILVSDGTKPGDDLTQVLEDVRLGYILSRFKGLDSVYEWSSVLSLGEQQRLAFARLLLSKPKLVLLDESTSALDEANEAHLYEKINEAGITYISIGHRRTLYAYHSRVLQIATADADSEQCNWNLESIDHDSLQNILKR